MRRLLPMIQSSYQSLIRKAAQTVRHRTNLAKYHSSGLVTYLRNITGLDVPDPIYD